MKDIKFTHISDACLGAKESELLFGSSSSDDSWASLAYAVETTKKLHADFLFISGDMFDSEPTAEELARLDEVLATLEPATNIIYTQGRRDCLRPGCALASYAFHANVYVAGAAIFDKDADAYRHESATAMVDVIHFPKKNTYIYAAPFYQDEPSQNVLDGLRPVDDTATNVLVAYAGTPEGIFVRFPELRNAGFDYVALGGQASYKNMYNSRLCYPGRLEPIAPAETGKHGFISGTVTDEGTNARLTYGSQKEFKTLDIPVGNYTTHKELVAEVKRLIETEGRHNIFAINLVRQKGCEKNFDIAHTLKKYRISAVTGEHFLRTNYDDYIKVNRGNAFGRLLDMMTSADITEADSAKLAVDLVIDMSGASYRGGKRVSDKLYAEAVKKAQAKLNARRENLTAEEDLQEYEKNKVQLEEESDVLDTLNDTWAAERRTELELRLARTKADEVVPTHNRRYRKWGFRAATLPLFIFACVWLFYMPALYVKATYAGADLRFALTCFVSFLAVEAFFFVGYGLARVVDRRMGASIEDELAQATATVAELSQEHTRLHKLRVEYQIKDNFRREILENVNAKAKYAESVYYELKKLDVARTLLDNCLPQ